MVFQKFSLFREYFDYQVYIIEDNSSGFKPQRQ